MNLPLRRTGLNAQTPFFFSCARCLRCCRHKAIPVNPYEVTRLAANLGMSTGDFIDRYTHDRGTILNWEEDGTCVFLDSKGCGVHPDRPLVCRLYPLGRHVFPSGEQKFSEIEPDQGCKGVYSDDRTIAAYLDSQGARPFMEAADKYLDLFWKLCGVLEQEAIEPKKQKAIAGVLQNSGNGKCRVDVGFADVDAIVLAFCEKLAIPVPDNPEDKMLIHVQAVEAWANNIARRQEHETRKRQEVAQEGCEKSHSANH
jgi:hypothetical protein